MDSDIEIRRQAFLAELTNLTLKHRISIGGCGCCGSPWLQFDSDTIDDTSHYTSDHLAEKCSDNLCWVSIRSSDVN